MIEKESTRGKRKRKRRKEQRGERQNHLEERRKEEQEQREKEYRGTLKMEREGATKRGGKRHNQGRKRTLNKE